jgi:cbb3-type cytochrome oxidase maturation protein
MTVILWLIAASLILAVGGLAVFFWAIKNGQYEDLKGASMRILYDDEAKTPDAAPKRPAHHTQIPN